MNRPGLRQALLAAGVVLLLALPQLVTTSQRSLLTEILVWALFAVSFDVLYGYTGLLSFGHSAFFGVGAYCLSLSVIHWGAPVPLAFLIGVAGAALFTCAVAAIAVRLTGHYFVVITIVVSLVLYFAAMGLRGITGGDDGLNFPRVRLFGDYTFGDATVRYYTVLVVVSALYLLTRRIVNSPLGLAWKAVRDNEARARLLGYNPERLKFGAYVLSGTLAGIAGGLYALINSYTTVEFLHWSLSGDPVMWTIVGGAGTLAGPVLGTLVLVFLRDFLSTILIHVYPILVGAILIVSITFFPKGIVGSVTAWRRSRRRAANAVAGDGPGHSLDSLGSPVAAPRPGFDASLGSPAAAPRPATRAVPRDARARADGPGPIILETKGLTRAFGGLVALDHVDFTIRAGEIRAVIGPNGAGKTTLFNVITGVLPPTGGQILFEGEDISGSPAHGISQKGIARTVQVTSIFPALTVRENVWLGAQSRGWLHPLASRGNMAAIEGQVEELIALVGLAAEADAEAAELSHGDQRLLEIALALSTRPRLLLLDEPTAGLSGKETRDMVRVVRELSARQTIVIVEHDMDVVMELADTITVLHMGKTLAEGPPQATRENRLVQEVYLGVA
jgi:ABC-type branched-subunit amino acid transport system ATPase component/ABC-type branched-subunit amino acid transport system permease subunit